MDKRHAVLRAMPEPVLYDVFAEAANRLVAEYSALLSQAESGAEKEQFWARIHQIRAARHQTPPADRQRQIDLIDQWAAERQQIADQAAGQ